MTALPIKRRLKNHWQGRKLSGERQLKLHLGCGREYLPGYVNVDVSPGARSDLCMNFIDLPRVLAPESVIEAMMIHSLGYLNLWEARDFLAALFRLFAPGGNLIIELPDIGQCARKLLASENDPAAYLEGVRGFYAFGMDEIETKHRYTPYAFGWTGWHLKKELETIGYREVALRPPQTHERTWRDTRVEARRP